MGLMFNLIATVTIELIVILALIILYIYRFYIFGVNLPTTASSDAYINAGFGYYTPAVHQTTCLTPSGFCFETGTQLAIQECVENLTTGRGCLQNGIQTFETIVTSTSCLPECRSSIWEVNATSQCIPTSEVDANGHLTGVCLDAGIMGMLTRTLTCIPHDHIGVNACIESVAPGTVLTDPDHCTIDTSGTIATCQPGGTLIQTVSCVPDALAYPPCGVQATEQPNSSLTQPCTTVYGWNPMTACYSFDSATFTLLSGISQLNTYGFQTQPTYCVDYFGVDRSQPQNSRCRPPDDCLTSLNQVFNGLVAEDRSLLYCPTTGDPVCIQTCAYYDATLFDSSLGAYEPWRQLLLHPSTVHHPNFDYGSLQQQDLTLEHIPCPGPGGRSLSSGGGSGLLQDCLGDPAGPLANVTLVFYTPATEVSATCSQADISQISSAVFQIKPISVTGSNLSCKITVIQGQNYIGLLTLDSTMNLIWRQALASDFILPTPDFILSTPTSNSDGTLTMNLLTSNGQTVNVNGLPFGTFRFHPISTFTLRDINGVASTSVNPNVVDMQATNYRYSNTITYMKYRETRWNSHSCNVYYSPLPPNDYLQVDTNDPTYTDSAGTITYSKVRP
jgi:hypothetical protein